MTCEKNKSWIKMLKGFQCYVSLGLFFSGTFRLVLTFLNLYPHRYKVDKRIYK